MNAYTKTVIIISVLMPLIIILAAGFKVFRWKMYIWLPDYILQKTRPQKRYSGVKHIVFLIVDHYEPGFGDKGAQLNREWLVNYRKLADKHKDSYGRKPQHTWFYAYDHKNELVMPDLSCIVKEGYGEIEFHWHHKHDSNETFPTKLAEGIDWFNSYGAMIDKNGTKSFGFIHGDWSLDNARGAAFCGVSRELDILKSQGCYADFTFPAFANSAQPAKVNSIYYAKDDDKNKSYNTGVDAEVGKENNHDLLIFEGPLTLVDYGAIETDPYPNQKKIDSWINANIHVKSRPEWVFVKTYTHGMQSREVFFSDVTDNMFSYLKEKYGTGKYRLHYVTAREAYNIVKAAEDGKSGDPKDYYDYSIQKPLNRIQ